MIGAVIDFLCFALVFHLFPIGFSMVFPWCSCSCSSGLFVKTNNLTKYLPHKAVAEVSNHNEPIERKSGIHLVRTWRESGSEAEIVKRRLRRNL